MYKDKVLQMGAWTPEMGLKWYDDLNYEQLTELLNSYRRKKGLQ